MLELASYGIGYNLLHGHGLSGSGLRGRLLRDTPKSNTRNRITGTNCTEIAVSPFRFRGAVNSESEAGEPRGLGHVTGSLFEATVGLQLRSESLIPG
eukprot:2069785-Rhodomonas_salina.1